MTSRNSFFKILKTALKNRLWGIALALTGFFFALPVYAALCAQTIHSRIAMLVFVPGSECALFARDALGEGNKLIMFMVCVIAVFMAFNGFSYLYSKSKVDLFHSVPARRETIFAAEYVAGFIAYIVPYIIFMFVAILVGAVNGMLDGRGIGSAFIMLFINILGFLAIYNTTIIAIVLTGNMAVGVLATGVFFFYGIIANLLFMGYQTVCFITKSSNDPAGISKHVSPFLAFYNLTDGMGSYTGIRNLHAGNFVLFTAFIVITLAFALFLFRKRPSESAGKSMAFKKSMPVISVLLLAVASLAGGLVFEEFSRNSIRMAYGWYLFGFVMALVFGHFVIQAIYYQDFKSLFKNMLNPVIAGVLAAIIAIAFIFDLTGYDSYVPKDAEVEGMAIGSYDMQGNIEYFNFDSEIDEYGNHNVGMDTVTYRLDNMNITDKQLIHELALVGIEDSKLSRQEQLENSDIYAVGTENHDYYALVHVKYKLKNGKNVLRSYNINLANHMDLYKKIYANEDYKAIACPMLVLKDEDISDIGFSGLFGEENVKFSSAEMKQLVDAYKADVMEQDAYSLHDEVPYGYLYKGVSFKDGSYTQIYTTNKAYIYPSFKRTTALLDKAGINHDYYKSDISNISSIVINNYSRCDEMGNPETTEYTDSSEIKKILENCYPSDLTYVENALFQGEPLDIMVNFKTTPWGNGTNLCYACRIGMLPGFVYRDLGM